MKKFTLSIVMSILTICTSYGITASPTPFVYTQPDGTELILHFVGDEYYHWTETSDNSVVVEKDGFYEYATITNNDIIPSGIQVSNNASSEQKSQLPTRDDIINVMLQKRRLVIAKMDSINKAEELNDIRKQDGDNPTKAAPLTSGNLKVLCILIGFPDKPFTKSTTDFANLWNQSGYNYEGSQGSVKNFYSENSYSNMNVTATVVGPYTAKKNSSYYDTGTDISNSKIRDLIREALTAAKNDVQFQDYDLNGDHYIDAVHVVFAGYGKESGSAGIIWSHNWYLSIPVWQGIYRGKYYFCTPELAGNSGTKVAPIGTVCHEYGHNLGAPDYYDLSSNGYPGTGHWDVMCSGGWNNNGRCPAHHNPYTKAYIYNWLVPMVIPSTSNVEYTLTPSHNTTSIYRINTATSGEFFLLENKKKLGFNSYVVSGNNDGLLIYHIHSDIQNAITNQNVNSSHPQKCYIVNSNGTCNPNSTPSSYGLYDYLWAYPTYNQSYFSSSSVPSAVSWAGVSTGVNLCNIRKSGNNIKFIVNPQIYGSNTLDTVGVYSISNVPSGASIKWTYTANVNKPISYQVLYPVLSFIGGDSTLSVTIQRNKYLDPDVPSPYDSPSFPPSASNRLPDSLSQRSWWVYYTGTATLKATITHNNDTHTIKRTINLASSSLGAQIDFSSDNANEQSITASRAMPQYRLVHPNLISTGSFPLNIYKTTDYMVEPYNEEYVIELWDDKSRLIKRLDNSSVNLSFETGSLPAGLYFLRLIVNGKVETVEKIIKIQ